MQKFVWVIVTVMFGMTLASCGGGSGGGGNMISQGAAVSTKGTITAFGSVVVNGVHYDVNGATIMRNGQAVTQAQLAVGQIATITGDRANDTTGHADNVDVEDQLVGPITSIDATGGSLVALGQTITVDSNTSFGRDISPAGLAGLIVGDVIEVSGLAAADSHIVATRIEREASTTFQVVGKVAGLDTTAHKFTINALTVDYSAATVSGFASGAPANDDVVDVKGTTFDATTTTLTATRVSPAEDETTDVDHGDDIEREGLITRFVSATDFDVAGKPVTTNSSTDFEDGTAGDLALNVRVEVEGKLDANDVLVAQKVAIRKAGIAELKGNVTAVDATGGTVELLGATVTVTADTRLEDKSDAAIEQFNLSNLQVGDTIGVRGFENPVGSGNITATRLEREQPSTDVVVGGFYEATTPPQFTILGIAIDATNAQFTNDWHNMMTSDQFFAQAAGHVVFAFGTLNGTTVDATKVFLSLNDDCGDQDEHDDGQH